MDYFVIRPYRGALLSPGAARTLIGFALRLRGTERWEAIGIDAFSGGGENLLIARPAPVVRVRVAEYALPALRKYFTE